MISTASEQQEEVRIVEFTPKFAHYFRDINREWLEEYFEVERYDQIVLNDPKGQIIEHGGFVFFAVRGDEVVGTCALIKQTERKYELAKMGVRKGYRGHGVGRLLAQAAIEKARSVEADTLVLATSKKLEAANSLYYSLGFHEVNISEIGPLPYKRTSIVMRMRLSEEYD
jgi:GNAT superfamily N-acetyltransferase